MSRDDWRHLAQARGLQALERAVNRALALDTAGASGLLELDGAAFDFRCTSPHLALGLRLRVQGGALRITRRKDAAPSAVCEEKPAGEDAPAASLEGPAEAYWQLFVAEDPAAALINGSLTVGGDSRALEKLWHTLSQLEPDWEQPLAEVIGDIPAHRIGRTLRRLWRDGSGLRKGLLRQLRHSVDRPFRPRTAAAGDAFAEFSLLRRSARRAMARWSTRSSKQPSQSNRE